MAIRLESNSGTFTLPDTVDLREVRAVDRWEPVPIVGGRGVWIDRERMRPRDYELVLAGVLTGEASVSVEASLRSLTTVLQDPPVLVVDEALNRRAWTWPRSMAYRRVGGHPWQMLEVTVRLLAAEGISEALSPQEITGTITARTTTPVRQHLELVYSGTYPVGPVVEVQLDPGAVWQPRVELRAGNLLVNGGFLRGTETAEGWTPVGDARLVVGEGVVGERFVETTVGAEWQQSVPVNGGQTYALSAFVQSPDGGTALLQVDWKDASGSLVSSSTSTPSPGTAWAQATLTDTSPNAVFEAVVRLGATSGTVQFDAVQLEPFFFASPFTEARALSLGRDAPLDYNAGDRRWRLDLDQKLALREDAAGTWTRDLDHLTGFWWELTPTLSGWNYLLVEPPTGASVQVRLFYRERFL